MQEAEANDTTTSGGRRMASGNDGPRAIRCFLWVAIPLLAFYLLVPNPGLPPSGNHIDPLTNAVTGWHLGMRGTVVLDGFEDATAQDYFRNIGWFVDSPRGPVSQYPPGAAALSAPLYWIANEPAVDTPMTGSNNPQAPPLVLPMPSVGPANVTAAITVAIAMGVLAATLLSVGLSFRFALLAGGIAGLVTPFWTVAASALWQHGPGAMWVAIGVLLASRERYLWSGLAFGAAVMTRPHLALIAAAIGVYVSWKERRTKPMLLMAVGSGVGLAGLLAYNWWLWGRLTVSGGYSVNFGENLVEGDLVSYARNIFSALLDPTLGILMVSVFFVPLLLRVRPAWKLAPAWARGAALGAVIYLLVQYKANRYSGGAGFLGYRYPLEPFIAATPLLALSFTKWAQGGAVARVLFAVLVVGSALLLLW